MIDSSGIVVPPMVVRASNSLWINDLFSFYFERQGIATTGARGSLSLPGRGLG